MHLNDFVKVKLTDLGKDIYYHQHDHILKDNPRLSKYITPHYPEIDSDGYTQMLLWEFIQLYGNYIGMGAANVIEPLEIIPCKEDIMEHVYCTHCKWFNITEDEIPTCKYETECDICDPEDSSPHEDRPHYEKPYVVLPKEIWGYIWKE